MTAPRPEFEVAAWVAEQRRRQGLPPKIEDEATLVKVAALVAAVLRVDTQAWPTPMEPKGLIPRSGAASAPDHRSTTTPQGAAAPRRRIDRSAGQQEGHQDATRHP
jgi:hypothetical protein